MGGAGEGLAPFAKVDVRPAGAHVAACPACSQKDVYKTDSFTVFYDGQPTIRRKIELAVEHGLAGVGIWELTQDSQDAQKSLIGVFPKRR